MKKLIFSIVAILAITYSLEAQRPQKGDPAEIAKKQTERMKENLNLSDEQTAKVEPINLEFAKKQQELFKNSGGDRAAMRESMKSAREVRKAELKKVLTEEQFKSLEAREKEMKERRGQGKGKRQDY